MESEHISISTPHFAPFLLGQKNSLVIAENESFMAIIEEKPLILGHCVVFPKRIEDSLFQLSDQELSGLMVFAKQIATALEKTVECEKVGVAVIGLQVRHAHVHLVPIQSADDLNFTRQKLEVSKVNLEEMAKKIRGQLKLS